MVYGSIGGFGIIGVGVFEDQLESWGSSSIEANGIGKLREQLRETNRRLASGRYVAANDNN